MFALISSRAGTPEDNSLLTVDLGGTDPPATSASGDFEARLRKLERLKKDGVISESEYAAKREQIMREKW
ncbi:MAG: SHOCT domain-containing protein [Proteobacteria bacterium]|nr:SHOCT domain-containing protein [Pseudomonadota bacterium]MBU1611712.1 SHOCT domain-containing protein [Pseudomonadota bacterium]